MSPRSLLFALTVLLSASAARADDTGDLQRLLNETVVTTASKSSEIGATAPATSTTITAEDLARYGIHSLDEALNFLSLGVVTQNPLKAVDVGARGVLLPNDNGDHLLLLVNGHYVNEPLFGSARFERGLGIPMEMVDHIEVVLGPGSVLYGSNAMLGVVNVITKRAKDWTGVHVVGETEVAKSYRAMGGAATPFELLDKPGEVSLGVEYYVQDGPAFLYPLQNVGIDPTSQRPARYSRNGPENGYWGGVSRNGYYSRVPSALLRLEWGNFTLNVHAKAYQRAVPYRSRYTSDYFDFDDPDSHELDRHLWADLVHRVRATSSLSFTSRLYADSWDFQSYRNSSEVSACFILGDSTRSTCTQYTAGISRWAGLEERMSIDWLKDNRLVTVLGVDGRLQTAGFKIDALDFYSRHPLQSSIGVIDRAEALLGAYAQQTYAPAAWLGFNGGARFDKDTRFDGVFSPRLAASLRPWRGGTVKAIYSEAFRAPSFAETDLVNFFQVRAGELKPERERSIEASMEQKFGAQRLLFGVFRTWWSDLVEQTILTSAEAADAVARGELVLYRVGAGQFRNVSSIDNYGFNATYDGALGGVQQFRYGFNGTAALARRSEPRLAGSPLAVAPSLFGNARVSYDLPGQWPTLALAATYVNGRPADRAYDGGWAVVPYAPPQLEGRFTVSGDLPVRGLSYRASLNAAMESYGPYVVGPGQKVHPNIHEPSLVPVDRLRVTVGLKYDFPQ
jgi:outer membrane receptor for ferrienterochelin and colicins